ncbi:MAG: hypothetical protein ACXAC2_18905 [Candidatus Kariarchaeaceae archaeon]
MPICSSCYQYVSERTSCPNCKANLSTFTKKLSPKKLDLKSISLKLNSDGLTDSSEINSSLSVKRKLTIISSNRNSKIKFLNLPWIFSNETNTRQWLEFSRDENESDNELKFRLDISFLSLSQNTRQITFTRPVQEIKFHLSDAFIILFSDISDLNRIYYQLMEMNLINRPIFFIGNITIDNLQIRDLQIFQWLNSQEALTSLANSIINFERNIDINFVINITPRRAHIVVSDIVGGWDGTPTIKVLGIEFNSLRKKSRLNVIEGSEARIMPQAQEFGNKCVGHGEKLSQEDIFVHCKECKGPICSSCYDSFEKLCPGSLFSFSHYLPVLENE